jgi:hypothetical protein
MTPAHVLLSVDTSWSLLLRYAQVKCEELCLVGGLVVRQSWRASSLTNKSLFAAGEPSLLRTVCTRTTAAQSDADFHYLGGGVASVRRVEFDGAFKACSDEGSEAGM